MCERVFYLFEDNGKTEELTLSWFDLLYNINMKLQFV